MGRRDPLAVRGVVHVAGRSAGDLPMAGFATAGVGGIDAVVSQGTAAAVGLPTGNAIVVSAPKADLTALVRQIKRVVPARTAVQPLVYTVLIGGVPTGGTGIAGGAALGAAPAQGGGTPPPAPAPRRRGLP